MAAQTNTTGAGHPPEAWETRISDTRFATLEHVEITESTNADLIVRAGSASDGTVRVTDHQTAGRGRLGRTWDAPPGTNLLVSIFLRPDWMPSAHSLVTASLAVAGVEALAELGVPAAVKWPNDLMIEKGAVPGKVAGILAEYTTGPPPAVVVGLGVNLAWPAAADNSPPGATSLHACGFAIDRWELLAAVLNTFEGRLVDLATPDGIKRLQTAHMGHSATIGRNIRVETTSGALEGTAVGISTDGSLLVQPDDRGPELVAVASGDVIHLRSV